ncbi:MAG: dihydropteroate synthase [Methylobacillus sp.]|jgi:dihydropteroate synthase|nr:dihydropteroate synthase [Methylobacillus sp.]
MLFRCGTYTLDCSRPLVMGIVNTTPDSFSDGGQFAHAEIAVQHGLELAEQGADILDVGGESTRPDAVPVSLEEELRRVIPVVEALATKTQIPVSVDTYKPEVMQAAIAAGASMINDVFALTQPGALEAVAAGNAGVCLMHCQGAPQTMQLDPHYDDVVREVREFLRMRVQACEAGGIARDRILIDPGFGFGKNRAHNLALLHDLGALTELGQPVLVGLSRKSVLGRLTGNGVNERLHASLAAAVISVMKGARIVRVHDVQATVDALKIITAVEDL